MPPATYIGLTSAEVAERIRRGQVNRTPRSEWAAYAGIVARNVFNLFNFLVTPAAVALFWLGKYQGAIAVSGVAIVNTVLGLGQEIKAKWHLDKLAILIETKARVRRDGQPQEVPAGEVVLGDLVLVSSGDAIVADGTVVESQYLEVDEALLTGESDPVRRDAGATLLSGSFCVAGEGSFRADRVGKDAFAQSTGAQARAYRYTASPLTKSINLLIQILTCTAVGLCLIYMALYWNGLVAEGALVQDMAATITSMVPQGLVVTATIAFALGAVRMSRRGAIVQRLHAVESMAAIDVLCADKTGTLTNNRLQLDHVREVGGDDPKEAREWLGLFAGVSVDQKNKSIQALRAAIAAPPGELLDQLPFKSQNRYSAVRVRHGQIERVLALGACEALLPLLDSASTGWEAVWHEELPTGLRLLLFAEADHARPFAGSLDGFVLRPLLLVALRDEMRPEAPAVLESLAKQGIAIKILSGDNAETVRATVARLDLPLGREPVVSGDELRAAANPGALIAGHGVFGRVAPLQKVEIVQELQRQGRRVAMIGDGVNDVLPIKRADLGIAMGHGSQAAKTVAGLVLEHDDFALLPEVLEEGRTIVRNLRRSAKLFLVKNVYSLVLILAYASGWFGVPFPYEPQQVTLLNWLVIGLPALVIVLGRERATAAVQGDFFRDVSWFALRSGVLMGLGGLAVLLWAAHIADCDVKAQRTLLLSVLIVLGIVVLRRALSDGETTRRHGDNRFRTLGMAVVPVYLLAMYVPVFAAFFQLVPLTLEQWLAVAATVAATAAAMVLSDYWKPRR